MKKVYEEENGDHQMAALVADFWAFARAVVYGHPVDGQLEHEGAGQSYGKGAA